MDLPSQFLRFLQPHKTSAVENHWIRVQWTGEFFSKFWQIAFNPQSSGPSQYFEWSQRPRCWPSMSSDVKNNYFFILLFASHWFWSESEDEELIIIALAELLYCIFKMHSPRKMLWWRTQCPQVSQTRGKITNNSSLHGSKVISMRYDSFADKWQYWCIWLLTVGSRGHQKKSIWVIRLQNWYSVASYISYAHSSTPFMLVSSL